MLLIMPAKILTNRKKNKQEKKSRPKRWCTKRLLRCCRFGSLFLFVLIHFPYYYSLSIAALFDDDAGNADGDGLDLLVGIGVVSSFSRGRFYYLIAFIFWWLYPINLRGNAGCYINLKKLKEQV